MSGPVMQVQRLALQKAVACGCKKRTACSLLPALEMTPRVTAQEVLQTSLPDGGLGVVTGPDGLPPGASAAVGTSNQHGP